MKRVREDYILQYMLISCQQYWNKCSGDNKDVLILAYRVGVKIAQAGSQVV